MAECVILLQVAGGTCLREWSPCVQTLHEKRKWLWIFLYINIYCLSIAYLHYIMVYRLKTNSWTAILYLQLTVVFLAYIQLLQWLQCTYTTICRYTQILLVSEKIWIVKGFWYHWGGKKQYLAKHLISGKLNFSLLEKKCSTIVKMHNYMNYSVSNKNVRNVGWNWMG